VESSCEFGIEPSGSLKCREVLEWLHSWRSLELVKRKWAAHVALIEDTRQDKSTEKAT
jgi:hypothetical protein